MEKEMEIEIEKRILELFPEIRKKLKILEIDTSTDRIRIIFEFEFKEKEIRNAIEIRQRRCWKNG